MPWNMVDLTWFNQETHDLRYLSKNKCDFRKDNCDFTNINGDLIIIQNGIELTDSRGFFTMKKVES